MGTREALLEQLEGPAIPQASLVTWLRNQPTREKGYNHQGVWEGKKVDWIRVRKALFKLIFMGVWLLYSVALLQFLLYSEVNQLYIYLSPLFSFPFRSPLSIEQSFPCSIVGSQQLCFIHGRVYMSIPISQFILRNLLKWACFLVWPEQDYSCVNINHLCLSISLGSVSDCILSAA